MNSRERVSRCGAIRAMWCICRMEKCFADPEKGSEAVRS
jgi:hypothetical protein